MLMTFPAWLVWGLTAVTEAASTPPLPVTLDLEPLRAVVVQHDGRWMPFDTLARDLVTTVTGEAFFEGRDPVLVLLAWTFDPNAWAAAPLIRISNAELRKELQLPPDQQVFSYQQLLDHEPLMSLIDGLSKMEGGGKLDPLQAKASDLSEKLSVLQSVFRRSAIKTVPDPADAAGAWRPIATHQHADGRQTSPVETAWAALEQAFRADDAVAFTGAAGDLIPSLQSMPAAFRPDPGVIATELRYNRLKAFRSAWITMAVGALLAVVAMFVRRRSFDALAMLPLVGGFALLSWGLWMRWHIAGRIPASNMYESLLFLSWGTGAFAILSMLVFRDRMVPMTASAMGALSLMLADCLPMDSFVRPIAPVLLDTVWMSIHVPIIMVSYSVLALAVLIAHVQLFALVLAPRSRQLAAKIDALHYWYVHVGSILLATGIFTGSMWAASSWGRYWGWDPKEVWSLVALLGYLTILHVRAEHVRVPRWGWVFGGALIVVLLIIVAQKFEPLSAAGVGALAAAGLAMGYFVFARGTFHTAVKSIVAFWMIIMTYLGVNYVLGIGLHSYGFGTGAMARYMIWTGLADLVVVAGLGFVRLVQGLISGPGEAEPDSIPLAGSLSGA